MTQTIAKGDFIEITYTGKLEDGTVFDTTDNNVAKEQNMQLKEELKPARICVGQGQLLVGLDKALEGKEIGKEETITIEPEQAFGKRDVKNMRIIPLSTFKEHKMNPQPGLQIDVDGQRGIVSRVAGGRVIVNFNHPLAGKKVTYTFTPVAKIEALDEQIKAFLSATFRFPEKAIKVELDGEKAKVTLPMAMPEQMSAILTQKVTELIKVKEIEFISPQPPKQEQPKEAQPQDQ